MTSAVLAGIAIGVVGEAAARAADLWRYRRPVYPALNVGIMFGLVMGSIASLVGPSSLAATFTAGFGVGLVWEILNFVSLGWWVFPNDRLLFLRGKPACAIGVSVAWGLVPVAITVVV